MVSKMKQKSKIFFIVAIIALVVVAWYLASPLILNKKVNEEFPIGANEEVTVEIQESMTDYQGSFIDADNFHKVSGSAKVISQDGVNYLRLEDFESTNGPDLYVYVSKDLDAEEYISLGRLKGNVGNQNYELSEEINFEEYDKVLIWCKAFGVLFGSADLEKQ